MSKQHLPRMRRALLGLALLASAGGAHAALVLDTGTPGGGAPIMLDGSDFAAAAFSLADGQALNSLQAYLTGGTLGDTFSVALYAADGSGSLPGTQIGTWQATWNGDGYNGVSGLSLTGLAAGNYWAAFEVGTDDTTTGLELSTGAASGTAPALGYAFNSGAAYQSLTGTTFSVKVDAQPVPLPASLLLLGSGVLGLGGRRKLGFAQG